MQEDIVNFKEISINSSDADQSGNEFDKFLEFKISQNLSMEGLQTAIASFGTEMSTYKIKKKIDALLIYEIEYYTVCPKCEMCFKFDLPFKGKKTCVGCDYSVHIKETNYFVYIPLKQQIIANVKHYFRNIIHYQNDLSEASDILTDVFQGNLYKKIAENMCKNKLILPLTLNADGAKVFNRNRETVWPLQLYQNYLPPKIRYQTDNILAVGLYYGKSCELSFQNFLFPLVQELKTMEEGFKIEDDNFSILAVPKLMHAIADLPAKAKLQEFVQFNSFYACGYCHQKGEALPNIGKKGKTVRYLYIDPPSLPKQHEEVIEIMRNLREGQQKNGIKDISALTYIKDFDIIWSFGIDDLHAIYEGVFTKMLDLFLNTKYHKFEFHLSKVKQQILDKRIIKIKPTMDITRKPRSLVANKNYLKGSEKRNLLLFYIIPSLDGLLKQKYIDHLELLSTSIFVLSKKTISSEEIDNCEKQLKLFAEQYEQLYGPRNVTMNTHLLNHIAESVRQLGPLWSQTTFAFETNNGILVQAVKGSQNVLPQIANTYAQRKSLQFRTGPTDLIERETNRVLGKGKWIELNREMKDALKERIASDQLFVYTRIEVNSVIYTSTNYKVTQAADFFFKLNDGSICKAIYFFILENAIYGLIEKFHILSTNSSHIHKIKSSDTLEVYDIVHIKQKLLYIKTEFAQGLVKEYISYVPNHYEKS